MPAAGVIHMTGIMKMPCSGDAWHCLLLRRIIGLTGYGAMRSCEIYFKQRCHARRIDYHWGIGDDTDKQMSSKRHFGH